MSSLQRNDGETPLVNKLVNVRNLLVPVPFGLSFVAFLRMISHCHGVLPSIELRIHILPTARRGFVDTRL